MEKEQQYQHFVSRFLLKNFTDNDNKTHTYKYENDKWTEHNICNTGGENHFYGTKDNSLENFFGKLETDVAAVVNLHSHQDKKDEAYIKLFILLMAFRSPSKNEIITKKHDEYQKDIEKKCSKEDMYSFFENRKKELYSSLGSSNDPEMKEIIDKFLEQFPDCFDDSDNSKFYPIITRELLQILPKIGKRFGVQIFESEYDLIIGETPTLSVNLVTNEVKTNGEEAGIINENVMYWLPIACNKVAFMYNTSNIVALKEKKLRKEDVDVLNYYQKEKSPFFYSRTPSVEIPVLHKSFNWIQHFNYIFEYKNLSQ
jgi:hypothetical protein